MTGPVPGGEAVTASETRRTNGDLARELIAKHGIDRYPTPELNALKLFEEAGEMVRHILRDTYAGEELADVAISLYALADKLGIDLDEVIQAKVDGETRSFASSAGAPKGWSS